jgi:hypothetical protein
LPVGDGLKVIPLLVVVVTRVVVAVVGADVDLVVVVGTDVALVVVVVLEVVGLEPAPAKADCRIGM